MKMLRDKKKDFKELMEEEQEMENSKCNITEDEELPDPSINDDFYIMNNTKKDYDDRFTVETMKKETGWG